MHLFNINNNTCVSVYRYVELTVSIFIIWIKQKTFRRELKIPMYNLIYEIFYLYN